MIASFRSSLARVPLLVAATALLALACGGGRARTPATVPDVVMITPPPESLRAAPDLFLPRAS